MNWVTLNIVKISKFLRHCFLVKDICWKASLPKNCDNWIYFHFYFPRSTVVQIWPQLRCQKLSLSYIVFWIFKRRCILEASQHIKSIDFIGISYCQVFLGNGLKFVNQIFRELFDGRIIPHFPIGTFFKMAGKRTRNMADSWRIEAEVVKHM